MHGDKLMGQRKTDDRHHIRKYAKVASRSKAEFPTTYPKNQPVTPGSIAAKRAIESQVGSLEGWKTAHTKFLWRWKKPLTDSNTEA
jgi:hypothetical protein